ncbi:hypothetical protein CBM2623_B30154 [Cupriavidus taiwanensis]|nr:hypothetical protein CBM2608_B30157 [Cupriavidus taiwanensis]SOZ74374.1 hypothetical protein CBM2617_B60045 [Cupriavidus taiwanensis]SOZ88304.1 hypothetical protein CBM2618_B50048 [Cupriavidus taiwanensis]SPA34507.1 hypothetical protein CBM2623_B30154 [Cupriavidus taiwanensis]SPA52193.1 hypothetical protein CBM2629_B40134 [Cupriavidus taiwanensis]
MHLGPAALSHPCRDRGEHPASDYAMPGSTNHLGAPRIGGHSSLHQCPIHDSCPVPQCLAST